MTTIGDTMQGVSSVEDALFLRLALLHREKILEIVK